MKAVLPQIETILKLKVPIVSTTEELSYPTKPNMRDARAIHALAKKAKVAVLSTGVNPGFVMDALPIMLTGVCERVESIRVDQFVDWAGYKGAERLVRLRDYSRLEEMESEQERSQQGFELRRPGARSSAY
jgi:2,4-diaminopentanoate dehydrogenase